jgi:putative alpha-1,2-mannosidase
MRLVAIVAAKAGCECCPKREGEGSVRTFGTFAARYGGLKVHFVARFNQPFASFSTWRDNVVYHNEPIAESGRIGVDVEFQKAHELQVITLKLEFLSIENARANQAEAGNRSLIRFWRRRSRLGMKNSH